MKKLISIVIPCFNEQESIPYFYNEVDKISKKMSEVNFEFLFVDDGSTDNTIKIVKELSLKDKRVKYISFSRNFGKEAAMRAGLKEALGDFVTIMDADLQDPPSLLIKMYEGINEGYEIVAARRVSRDSEPKIRSFLSNAYYKIISKMSKTEMKSGARDFRLMTRKVVDAINSLDEYNRYSKGIFSFVGFKTKWIEYKNVKRVAGKTKWSIFGLFRYAIEGITSFSTLPLTLSALFGLLFCFIALLGIIFVIVRTLIYGDPVSGWPSLICIILFVGGIQLLCLGIMGKYLAKTYLETKKRPLYIIADSNSCKNTKEKIG